MNIKNWFKNISIGQTAGDAANTYLNTYYSSFGKLTWIGAVGDIMPARGVQNILIGDKDGRKKIFSDTLPVLESFDLLIGNLEGPVTYNKAKIEKAEESGFTSDSKALSA